MFEQKEEIYLENLCSKEIKIQLTLLNTIYRATDGLTLDTLVLTTALSTKTIYKYIRELNNISTKVYKKNSIVLSAHNDLYYFYGNKVEFLTLRYLILEKCEGLQLIFELIPASSVNIYNFCSKYFLSESTLKNYIRKINNLFKYLNIKLITRKNEIYLVGDEAVIRYWCSSILWRTYNGLKWALPTMNKNKLSKLKFLIFENSDISLGKQSVFISFIAVCIVRSNSKHYILPNNLPKYYYNLTHNIDYFDRIEKHLQSVFSLNDLEKDFILLLFYVFPDFYKLSGIATYTLEELKRKSPKNFYSITKYIEFVQNKHSNWNIKSEAGQLFFYAVISSHIATDLLKEAYFNLQDLNLIEYVLKEFPTLLPSIQKIITPINPSLTNGQLKSLVFRIAQAHLLAFSPKDFEPELKILVISDSPIQIEREMVSKIKSLINYKYHIKLSSDQSEFDKYDLIISTGFYEGIDPSIPIIFVFPQIDKRDEKAILNACQRALETNH